MFHPARRVCALLGTALLCAWLLAGCAAPVPALPSAPPAAATVESAAAAEAQIPPYSGEPWCVLGEEPLFTAQERENAPLGYESYSELDALGRCGAAFALVGPETLPAEKRGSIGMVKPSGWQLVRYDHVDGQYLYNRCHLLGYQLTAENANVQNLITGTRYLNVQGMLPFEELVADYVKQTGGHVLYRVTPRYTGENLLADGVVMEAWSQEDAGESVCFYVYCYNVQPGVEIDYATGESRLAPTAPDAETLHLVLNNSSKKFHLPTCESVATIAEHNRQDYTGTRADLLAQGYDPCGRCKP